MARRFSRIRTIREKSRDRRVSCLARANRWLRLDVLRAFKDLPYNNIIVSPSEIERCAALQVASRIQRKVLDAVRGIKEEKLTKRVKAEAETAVIKIPTT